MDLCGQLCCLTLTGWFVKRALIQHGASSTHTQTQPTVWYDYFDHSAHAAGSTSHLAVDVNTIPLYQRSGSVVVTREMRDGITSTEGLRETGYRLRVCVLAFPPLSPFPIST